MKQSGQTRSWFQSEWFCVSVGSLTLPQAPGYGDIRLSLEVIPDTVNLEEPFQIVCKITNCRWAKAASPSIHPFPIVESLWKQLVSIIMRVLYFLSCFSPHHVSSERTMDLVLEMCNTRSIHWCGISGRQLGKLSPAASLSLPLTLLSSVQGLQVGAQLFFLPPPPVPSRPVVLVLTLTLLSSVYLLVSEHLWSEAHRHVPEEDVRVRRRGTGVRDLPVHQQRELRLHFLSFFNWTLSYEWTKWWNRPVNLGQKRVDADPLSTVQWLVNSANDVLQN